jgi:hypothetical protein
MYTILYRKKIVSLYYVLGYGQPSSWEPCESVARLGQPLPGGAQPGASLASGTATDQVSRRFVDARRNHQLESKFLNFSHAQLVSVTNLKKASLYVVQNDYPKCCIQNLLGIRASAAEI